MEGDSLLLDRPPQKVGGPDRGEGRLPGGRLATILLVVGSIVLVACGDLFGIIRAHGRDASMAAFPTRPQQAWEHPEVPPQWEQRWKAGQLVYAARTARVKPWLMPNLGNGYMGTQFGRGWMFMSGVYNGEMNMSHRAHVPVPFNVKPKKSPTSTALDFERGMVEEVYWWPSAYAIRRTYFHQALPHVVVTELEVNNSQGQAALTVELDDSFSAQSADLEKQSSSLSHARHCVAFVTVRAESPRASPVGVALCRARPPGAYRVRAGGSLRVALASTAWTTRDALPTAATSPLQAAELEFDAISRLTPEELRRQHVAAMLRLWRAGIEVEGNPELAKKVNSSWWNLLLSYREGQNMSSSPGGLANDCYKGHSFWDVEQFMWPNLLLFHPTLAEASLQYRYDRLDAARANAAAWRVAGLKFPWESAVTGEEVCPWKGGLKEIHINGDVSLACWQFWQATGSMAWLRSVGWPVLRGVAEFWAHWTATLPDGSFEIRGVVDVDERAVGVTNSAYTNAVAKLSLGNAVKAARLVNQTYHVGPNWLDMASGIPIPLEDSGRYHLEHATATGGNGLGVIMMQYPLGVPTTWPEGWSAKVRRSDLLFYAHKWPHGNAMYWWAFAINWLGLGEPDLAAKYLARTTARNVFGPFQIWSENPDGGGCPNFVTGAGGYLQVFWAGYGGIRLTDEALSFHDPRVPPDSRELRLRALAYRGSLVNVRITMGNISLQLHEASPRDAPGLLAEHQGSNSSSVLKHDAPTVFSSIGTTALRVLGSN